ncbi:hypothetical protein [Mycolicibacterium arenosum]|uniref:Uncharacterized protein n=1 Tax=Mycolicibacterium arenosum TaxID=2952157 RepID=A0ABT1M4B3_9MYCO|nr:hypothetical protein [Mycolicibacterium sp. CAU 1645]MCP9273435.1 hypothetical protein [Mycolicibacterium sp. CAU 1645]
MPEDIHLPLLAAAVLIWYLVCALRQARSERSDTPAVVWREATEHGWTEWSALPEVAASVGYDAMLTAVREHAAATSSAVQFAVVAHPAGDPEYTLRVLFTSEVRERFAGRELALTGRSADRG